MKGQRDHFPVHAMYGGDRSKEKKFSEIRLSAYLCDGQSSLKNLKSSKLTKSSNLCKCHPADYELQTESKVFMWSKLYVPTRTLDLLLKCVPSLNQIDDLVEEIQQRTEKDERTLVTTSPKEWLRN